MAASAAKNDPFGLAPYIRQPVNQQPIAANMALAMTIPATLKRMVKILRWQGHIRVKQHSHHHFQLCQVMTTTVCQLFPILVKCLERLKLAQFVRFSFG